MTLIYDAHKLFLLLSPEVSGLNSRLLLTIAKFHVTAKVLHKNKNKGSVRYTQVIQL